MVCRKLVARRSLCEVAWGDRLEVLKAGRKVIVDEGELCLLCRESLDVFCLENRDDLICKYADNTDGWREKINLVRAGFEKCTLKLLRDQSVTASQEIGMKVYLEIGFVTVDVFDAHFGVPASKIKSLTIHVVRLPDNEKAEGIFAALHTIPPELPHYRVEVYSINKTTLDDLLVTPSKTVWESQCKDRFKYDASKKVGNRPVSIRGGKDSLMVQQWEQIRLQAKIARKEQRAANDAALQEGEEAVRRLRHSGLDDHSEDSAHRKGKRQKGTAAGTGATATRFSRSRRTAVTAGGRSTTGGSGAPPAAFVRPRCVIGDLASGASLAPAPSGPAAASVLNFGPSTPEKSGITVLARSPFSLGKSCRSAQSVQSVGDVGNAHLTMTFAEALLHELLHDNMGRH